MNRPAALVACLGITMGGFAQLATAETPAPTVKRDMLQVEHIRIDSNRPFGEVRAALDRLVPRFDDRIRVLLQYGEFARVKTELEKNQGKAGLVIFSVATHGDWLQIRKQKP